MKIKERTELTKRFGTIKDRVSNMDRSLKRTKSDTNFRRRELLNVQEQITNGEEDIAYLSNLIAIANEEANFIAKKLNATIEKGQGGVKK